MYLRLRQRLVGRGHSHYGLRLPSVWASPLGSSTLLEGRRNGATSNRLLKVPGEPPATYVQPPPLLQLLGNAKIAPTSPGVNAPLRGSLGHMFTCRSICWSLRRIQWVLDADARNDKCSTFRPDVFLTDGEISSQELPTSLDFYRCSRHRPTTRHWISRWTKCASLACLFE